MIVTLDLGFGNLASVVRMIKYTGGSCIIINEPLDLARATKVIIAGVGSFDAAMRSIIEGGWRDILEDIVVQKKIPTLGICLGMQLFCKSSKEGQLPGLGWIDAEVVHFNLPAQSDLRVPHMGWNTIKMVRANPLLPYDDLKVRFYFVHSYHVLCNDRNDVVACSDYGGPFVAAVQRDNIFGVQFHPEKSHRFGMALLKRFVEL